MNNDIEIQQLVEQAETTPPPGSLRINPATGGIIARAQRKVARDRMLSAIVSFKPDVVDFLRQRQGLPAEEEMEIEIPSHAVPSIAVQRANRENVWLPGKGQYFKESEREADLMWAQVRENDEVINDFAHSFTIRRANGLLEAVNRRGQIVTVSPYSSAHKG